MPRLLAASISMTSSERPADDGTAAVALAAGFAVVAVGAVERLGQQLGGGGLAGAARPGEQVGVADRARGDRVRQRAGDVLLPDDLLEGGRPVFAVKRDVRHRQSD